MNFEHTLNFFAHSGHQFRVKGFFNVENGQAGLSNRFLTWCDCLSFGQILSASCENCGRNADDYVATISGDGDGVFVVVEIVNAASDKVVGAFTVFDYKYEIANSVRSVIEQELFPSYPLEVALQFGACEVLNVREMANTGLVLFGNGGSGRDSDNAIVDVALESDNPLRVIIFTEKVSTNPDEWVNRLAHTQGLEKESTGRAMLRGEASGQELYKLLEINEPFTLPSFIPRAVLVLNLIHTMTL